jgi:hypothetical protein
MFGCSAVASKQQLELEISIISQHNVFHWRVPFKDHLGSHTLGIMATSFTHFRTDYPVVPCAICLQVGFPDQFMCGCYPRIYSIIGEEAIGGKFMV